MQKISKQAYTAELKEQAEKRVKDGKRVSAVAKEMGLVEQTLRNRVKAFDVGRLKRDVEILNKRRRPSRGMRREVRLDRCAPRQLRTERAFDVLAVSDGGYRAWQGCGTPDRRGLTDAQLPALIQTIHAALKGAYGMRRRSGSSYPCNTECA